jgi:hypothetical protein
LADDGKFVVGVRTWMGDLDHRDGRLQGDRDIDDVAFKGRVPTTVQKPRYRIRDSGITDSKL